MAQLLPHHGQIGLIMQRCIITSFIPAQKEKAQRQGKKPSKANFLSQAEIEVARFAAFDMASIVTGLGNGEGNSIPGLVDGRSQSGSRLACGRQLIKEGRHRWIKNMNIHHLELFITWRGMAASARRCATCPMESSNRGSGRCAVGGVSGTTLFHRARFC